MRPGAEGSPPSPGPTGPRWQRFLIPALIVLVAALGTAHILVRTSTYGAALNDDAFNYLGAAENLVAGEGLLSLGGGQMVLYAPFFSIAMAFLNLFGLEPVDGGRFLNAAAFGLLILAAGLWLSRRLKTPALALGAAVAVMVALPLTHSASTLLIEEAAGACVAWFHFQARYYDYSVEELPYLEPVAELADGSIFRVNRAYAPPRSGSP